MLDRVLGDDELISEAEPPDLDFQKGVDGFSYLVLKLTSAENTNPALGSKEHREPCRIPGFRT